MKRSLVLLLSLVFCTVQLHGAVRDSVVTIKKDSVFRIPVTHDDAYSEAFPDVLEDGLIQATVTDSVQRYIDLAQTLIDKVRAAQNFITNIDANSKFELPVGITKTIGGISYELVIHAVRLKPTHAELDMFLQFEIPQNGKKLTFMARGIKLTQKGGIVGDAKLELLGDNAINFNGDKIQLILKGGTSAGGSGTYAIIDCDGFREVSVDAQVKFSRDLIVPENADGKIIAGNVYAGFSAVLTDWNDMLIQLDMPAFQATKLKDFGFKASNVVFDFSDTRNAPAVIFPEGYINTNELPGNQNLWRGFYMRELLVRMPPQFQKKGGQSTSITAQNMLIDNRGVSGLFAGTNLIPLNEGTMSGWAFSLDSIAVKLMANELQEAALAGQILIPVSKESSPFDYTAFISQDEYMFTVAPTEDLEFDLWAAHVDIYEGSSLEIRIADHKFLPKAILHGRMNVSAKLGEGGKGVELADIQFEDLQLQTVKPYIKVGNFSFGSELAQQKLAQFPISIQNIGLRSLNDTETALDFNLLLNLVGEQSGGFAADAGLSLIAKIGNSESGNQKWKLKDIEVRSIKIDIDGGAFKFNGSLAFYRQDPMYGNGFNGLINAEFKPGLKVKASAVFGNVNGERYWYADAMATFNSGVPIFTGVAMYGFGGGAYYHMKMDSEGVGSDLGKTSSGIVYVPDVNAGLGLKAVVKIGSHPKPEAFNGDVTFEIAFFQGGGIRRIAFMGNGYLVTPGLEIEVDELKEAAGKMAEVVKEKAQSVSDRTYGQLVGEGDQNSLDEIFGSLSNAGKEGQISAHVSIDYDFENRVLHGTFEAFVNVAGGIVRGVGSGGRAGWAVLHFAPQEWYVYVGTPDDRIGLSIGIGSIRAQATSYMMVGTKILGSPPPPPQVSRILREKDLDYMRDLNALGTGAGFAFGSSLEINTGDLKFMMFYARFEAGAGFDVMLKDYGDARCAGSTSPLGINGWYANGQAYAYLDGRIGIRVRVFGRKKNIKILEIGAAAILQAKLPNPFWMRGIVGGHFSVLGGLVRGNCKFKMTIGKDCEIVGDDNLLDDIKVISEITPSDGSTEVSVFNAPQGVFNMEVNKQFEIIDPEDNKPRYFQAKLDHFKVMDGKTEIPATLEWNENNDVVALNPFDVLPPTKDLTTSLQVSFEEKILGSWRPVVDDGKVYVENQATKFKTGVAPDYIPESNILYNYPVTNQLNFYSREYAEGYVQLKQGQPYLFEANPQFEQKTRFRGASGQESLGTIQYVPGDRRVVFNIPDNLSPSTIYQIEAVNLPKQTYQVDQNVKETITASAVSADTEIKTKKAEGQLDILAEKTIYAAYFRTSKFGTVREKINSLPITNTFSILTVPWRVHRLMSFLSGPEYFDLAELSGTNLTLNEPLIQLEADLQDNEYYNKAVYPLVYADYPVSGCRITWRNVNDLGLAPVKAMFMYQEPADQMLTPNDVSMGSVNFSASRSAYTFDLPYYMDKDFAEIQAQIVNRYIQQSSVSDRIRDIIFSSYPPVRPGKFVYKLKYTLPGINKTTTELNINTSY